MDLLTGECTYSEETKIRSHLAVCPQCTKELTELMYINSLLDDLSSQKAPPDLYISIMGTVEEMAENSGNQFQGNSTCIRSRPAKGTAIPGMLRDLISAAAVALTLFWLGTGWISPLTATTENKISGAVLTYMYYTEVTLDRTKSSISVFNHSLFSAVDKLNMQSKF